VSILKAERKKKKDLRCTVCGEKAVGYNFDQISCESCKAFFRRNALRDIVNILILKIIFHIIFILE
jgi:hypothetical protein